MGCSIKRIKAVKSLPKLHKTSGLSYKESLPSGLQSAMIKPSKAEAILGKALEDRGIGYTATLSQNGQKINFRLDSEGAVIRINSQPVAAYGGIDAEQLLFIANNIRVIDTTESDIVSNVEQVISNIGGSL